MKKILAGLGLFLAVQAVAQSASYKNLLSKMVNTKGEVNYKLLHDKPEELNAYLKTIAAANLQGMSKNAQKALWMNAYNAYTLKVVIDHYPLKSITDIKEKGKTAWDMPIAKVAGKTYTLNQIEHEILRKQFNDYRIHAGINCASFSCPVLLNQPFTEANVDQLLEVAFKSFVNDPQRNRISKAELKLSQIFKWFAEDFERDGGVLAVVRKYAETEISATPDIDYLEYNWSLNGK